jgi:glyoxylase-like metal-dependent hydrolase (beta-lactamase superfamily II)
MATAFADSSYVCKTCGTQFPAAAEPPPSCPICEDERQYVPASGQQWTTLEKVRRGHRNSFQQYEPNLLGIGTTPEFAIGQRALLVRTPHGNFLWDCISLIDEGTIAIIKALGGLAGIAISHPHYYTSMLEWSSAFGNAPVYLHAADHEWVMRSGAVIEFWEGERKELAPGVTLIRCGGHFPGATVLHWADGAEGRGALLSGDVIAVMPDGCASFMFSYPNAIPLPAKSVQAIGDAVEGFKFERVYGAFWERVIKTNASAVVAQSVARYLRAIATPDG